MLILVLGGYEGSKTGQFFFFQYQNEKGKGLHLNVALK